MATSLNPSATAGIVARASALFEDLSFTSAREWKAAKPGRKVIGYMPIYVPREIIHAAGMLPLGIVGGGDDKWDAEDVVRAGGEKAGDGANYDSAPQ